MSFRRKYIFRPAKIVFFIFILTLSSNTKRTPDRTRFEEHIANINGLKIRYIDEGSGFQIADKGVAIKIIFEGIINSTKTKKWAGTNYILRIPRGYEGKTGFFYVDNDLTPIDNQSILIGSEDTYLVDLHVHTVTQNFPPDTP